MIKITIENGRIQIESDSELKQNGLPDLPREATGKANEEITEFILAKKRKKRGSYLHMDKQGNKHCKVCGNVLPSNKIVYCSEVCRKNGLRLNYKKAYYRKKAEKVSNPAIKEGKCRVCGSPVFGKGMVYCSNACRRTVARKRALQYYYKNKERDKERKERFVPVSVPVQVIS